MRWTPGQQALHELQTEREGSSHQIRVVVCRVCRAAFRQRVAELVDSHPLHRGAAARGDHDDDNRDGNGQIKRSETPRRRRAHGDSLLPSCVNSRETGSRREMLSFPSTEATGMTHKTLAGLAAIGVVCSVTVGQAHVTRIEIVKVESPAPAPANAGSTATPPYERLSGKFYGELDPKDPKNALITDIQYAPRNARGKVEYVGTFSLMKPIDMSKSSGVLMYSVVNRGGGTASASPEGHVSLVSGWQGDVVPSAANHTIQVPRAKNPDGTSITGPLVIRWVGQKGSTAALIIPRATPSPYPPVTMDTSKAVLVSAVTESATGVKSGEVKIPAGDWAFADCEKTAFPGTPDQAHICLKNGFNPSLLYELQYTVKDPLVLGIGFAATRDLNSFFRYEKKDDAGTLNPVAGNIRWAVSEGSSQSGTFLRAFIGLGFNQDEANRIVWDGSNPHIASRVLDMNRRFAEPGRTVPLYELGMEAPLWAAA